MMVRDPIQWLTDYKVGNDSAFLGSLSDSGFNFSMNDGSAPTPHRFG